VDAFLTCFKHASNNNYKNILIFEDDFICDEKLLNKSITNNICNFIKLKENLNENFIYHIGVLPYISSFTDNNHRILYKGLGTHAIIYSNEFIKKTLQYDFKKIDDWDSFSTNYLNNKKYIYDKCLCYQPFTDTENSKFWGTNGDILHFFYYQLLHKSFKLIKMDKNPKLGFDLHYMFCLRK
jgi:hypothetical protein